MYRHILIGVDGGPNGRDAIALARRLGGPAAELSLVHVYGGEGISARDPAAENAAQHAAAMALLESERSQAGVEGELVSIASASVGRGLHELASSGPSDLIVVGSTRHGLLGRVLLGDDTRAALTGAPCAVAVAPRGYASGNWEIGFVGIAYDFSDSAEAVLCVAWEIACEHGAPLSALYVAPLPTVGNGEALAADWSEFVEAQSASDEGCAGPLEHLEGRVAYGELGRKLAGFSSSVDLLIVGCRGRGALRKMIFGSTSDYLAHHAHCALLILPPAALSGAREELPLRTGRDRAHR